MQKLMAILTVLFTTTVFSQTTPELTVCNGDYALCAASTCVPTGKTITGNNGVP